jgi:hypothetical protein
VTAMASQIKTLLPVNVHGIPFTPEMKIAAGLVDMIRNSEDSAVAAAQVTRIEAGFCLGETNSSDTAAHLTTLVLQDLSNTRTDRQRRLQPSLDSRYVLDESRQQAFWHRLLTTVDEDACLEILLGLNVEVTKDVAVFTFDDSSLFERNGSWWPAECLHAFVVDLALQPEFCFVDGFQPLQTHNILASGIVQSGSSVSKLFYDAGINGTGQVVGLSDTGIDLDNCAYNIRPISNVFSRQYFHSLLILFSLSWSGYFYDGVNAVTKSAIGATTGPVNVKSRKVVQYVSYADGSDVVKGHGSKCSFAESSPKMIQIFTSRSRCNCVFSKRPYQHMWLDLWSDESRLMVLQSQMEKQMESQEEQSLRCLILVQAPDYQVCFAELLPDTYRQPLSFGRSIANAALFCPS